MNKCSGFRLNVGRSDCYINVVVVPFLDASAAPTHPQANELRHDQVCAHLHKQDPLPDLLRMRKSVSLVNPRCILSVELTDAVIISKFVVVLLFACCFDFLGIVSNLGIYFCEFLDERLDIY